VELSETVPMNTGAIVRSAVDYGDLNGVPPVSNDCGSRVLAIEDQHLAGKAIWGQSSIVHVKMDLKE
jgi:hypothetical protein